MFSDFEIAYEQFLDSKKSQYTPEQFAEYKRFALSNRNRADDFILQLKHELGYELAGKSVLDIGSAYGGFVIQCAKQGAISYGVEILPYLHNFAIANAKGEKEKIELLCENILDNSILRNIKFDLLIINDVFEHVFDIENLFLRISDLSEENAKVYFAIPNGESYHSIKKEGHKFIPALTLLEPGYWGNLVGNFNIYYRPLEIYDFYFKKSGFKYLYLKIDYEKVKTSPERVIQEYNKIENLIEKKPFKDTALNIQAQNKLSLLKQKLDRDLACGDSVLIHLKYEQYFWTGYASKNKITSSNLFDVSNLFETVKKFEKNNIISTKNEEFKDDAALHKPAAFPSPPSTSSGYYSVSSKYPIPSLPIGKFERLLGFLSLPLTPSNCSAFVTSLASYAFLDIQSLRRLLAAHPEVENHLMQCLPHCPSQTLSHLRRLKRLKGLNLVNL